MKKLSYAVLLGLWLSVLTGFTSTALWLGLSVVGAGLALGGFSLSRDALPVINEGVAYLVVFLIGVALMLAALATLLPGMPGSWLATTATGWDILAGRSARLEQAIEAGDPRLARRLAARGLGTDQPIDKFGRPLLFDAADAEMVTALLGAGLAPDASDGDGRTLAMLSHDENIVAALLRGGADPNARDAQGRTALHLAPKKGLGYAELLLAAGADPFATDDNGIAVVDEFPAIGPLRELLERNAGGRVLPLPREISALDRGRTDWLLPTDTRLGSSGLRLIPEDIRYGDTATLEIILNNESPRDRLLEVRAVLASEAYFVAASHDGRIRNPGLFRLSQDIRWPLLSLPAGRGGKLRLEVVARNDVEVGEFSIDVRYRSLAEIDSLTGVRSGASPEEDVLTLRQSLHDAVEYDDSLDWLGWAIPLGVVVALYLGFLAVVRVKKHDVVAVVGVVSQACAIGMSFMLFVFLAGLAEPWVSFQETRCQILDRRIELKETTTTSGGTQRTRTTRTLVYAVPVAAVRYSVDGQAVVTTGFGTDAVTRSVNEFKHLPLGASVPCWVDPDDPKRFALRRNLNPAAVFGILLQLGLILVFALVSRAIRRKSIA